MIAKLIVISCFFFLLIGGVATIYESFNEEDFNLEEQSYQGPVPIGYNLEHFRKTGETIKEVVE